MIGPQTIRLPEGINQYANQLMLSKNPNVNLLQNTSLQMDLSAQYFSLGVNFIL